MMLRNFPTKTLTLIGLIAVSFLIVWNTFGTNIAGHRTVVQYPNGTIKIVFDPDWYLTWFGTETVYNDVITFDFDKVKNSVSSTLDQQGISVRYQDGGKGSVYGIVRYRLPSDRESMYKLHKEFRTNKGIANKLFKPLTEESVNLTANLMSSEEAYAEKRGDYASWTRSQIDKGIFKTKLKSIIQKDEVTGKSVYRNVPVIDYGEDGLPMHRGSDLKSYGINVSGFQMTDWGFEQKTLDQISSKREATMAIITAKANAQRAKQDTITAEEQGKARVMTAKYSKEEEKIRAVVDAEKVKEVAIIAAIQKVDVAEQIKLEAEQKKLAAREYKQEQILRGEGDGKYKELVMKADGALKQKLATYERVMGRFASAVEKQKWVPEVQMGGSGTTAQGGVSAAQNLIEMFSVKTAKDLALDMKMTGQ